MRNYLRNRCALTSFLFTGVLIAALAGAGPGQSPLHQLARALLVEASENPDFDPTGNSDLAQLTRTTFLVKSILPPALVAQAPLDGQNFAEGQEVVFQLVLENWLWEPQKATSASQQYAVGSNEPNSGHVHGWVFNLVTGARVRFYGANLNGNVDYDPDTGVLVFSDTFEPGIYKIYFQAQNHDHTPQPVVAAPHLPAIETVVFTVGDVSLDDLQI